MTRVPKDGIATALEGQAGRAPVRLPDRHVEPGTHACDVLRIVRARRQPRRGAPSIIGFQGSCLPLIGRMSACYPRGISRARWPSRPWPDRPRQSRGAVCSGGRGGRHGPPPCSGTGPPCRRFRQPARRSIRRRREHRGIPVGTAAFAACAHGVFPLSTACPTRGRHAGRRFSRRGRPRGGTAVAQDGGWRVDSGIDRYRR